MYHWIAAPLLSLAVASPALAADSLSAPTLTESEVSQSVETVDANPWEAQLGFKLTADQVKTDRAFSYLGYIAPTYRLTPSWKLGLSTEAEMISQSGAQENHWNDSWLTVNSDGFPLTDSITTYPRVMSMLPTRKSERDAGLAPSPGVGITTEFTPTGDWRLDYDLEGIGLIRNSAKASHRADPEQPAAADGLDRWRLNQRVGLAHQFHRNLWLQGNLTHGQNWRWLGGREVVIGFEQILTYDWNSWSFGLGHRGETVVREANGETRALSFTRADGSTFFGSMAFRL